MTLLASHPDNLAVTERTRGGMFRFAGVPRGPAVVLARADGYAPYFGALTIEAGKQHGVRIGLLPEATTSGVVLDGNGCPAAGAHVHVGYNRALPGAGLLSVLTRARTVTRSAPGAARASPESTPTGKVADLLARPADRLDDHRQREVTVRGPAPPPPAGGSLDPAAHPC
ncbi:MAG: hypothetical protein OXG35_15500 [Acidobacteria bacterium]|nr:hypothetical protein [Acidobacteriota bacterium]